DGLTLLGQVTADAGGAWQFTTAALPDGVHPLTATATDAGGSTSDPSVPLDLTIDTGAPTVAVTPAAGQADPTTGSPVVFAVHFSEPVSGFPATAVDLSDSNIAGTLAAAVSGSGQDYTVSVTGMFGAGLVVAKVTAGAAADAAGNLSTASTSTDN